MSSQLSAEEMVCDDQRGDTDCAKCGTEKLPTTCWSCGGEGVNDHDCGEDTCCCLYPEDNVVCDICDGDGGYSVCPHCHPESFDD